MNLILFGPPGVGKGTQGERLASEYGLSHLAMGDILRAAVRDETDAGVQAKQFMDAGQLVPDAVVVAMIEECIVGGDKSGFLLDGFPRNVAQAEALDVMLDKHDLSIDRIVFMDAPEENLLKRLCGRMICRACGFGFHRQYSPPLNQGAVIAAVVNCTSGTMIAKTLSHIVWKYIASRRHHCLIFTGIRMVFSDWMPAEKWMRCTPH